MESGTRWFLLVKKPQMNWELVLPIYYQGLNRA